MRKINYLLPLLGFVLLVLGTGCEKIRLDRLEGTWELKSWTLIDANGTEANGTNLVPELRGGRPILVEFTNDGEATLIVFKQDSITYGDNALFENNSAVTELTFTDTISFFNPNITYKIDQLTLKYLKMHGPFTLNGTLYPRADLSFEDAD